jgi:hypothetical protein
MVEIEVTLQAVRTQNAEVLIPHVPGTKFGPQSMDRFSNNLNVEEVN